MYSLYHEAVCEEMRRLAEIPNSIFIGQQTASENFYFTLKDISLDKRYEMPVAEELQMGISLGLALEEYLPISIYQRMDFLPRACDQLVNHLDLIKELSRGLFNPKVIIRTTVGSSKPLDVGIQHNKNLIEGFRHLLKNIPVFDLLTVEDVHNYYNIAIKESGSFILVEHQDLYNE